MLGPNCGPNTSSSDAFRNERVRHISSAFALRREKTVALVGPDSFPITRDIDADKSRAIALRQPAPSDVSCDPHELPSIGIDAMLNSGHVEGKRAFDTHARTPTASAAAQWPSVTPSSSTPYGRRLRVHLGTEPLHLVRRREKNAAFLRHRGALRSGRTAAPSARSDVAGASRRIASSAEARS